MTRTLVILATVTLAACTQVTDAPDGTSTTKTDECLNAIASQSPANGDTDVYYRTNVFFTLAMPDPAATITIADTAGNVVPGSTGVVDTILTWSGDALESETTYNATLSYECGDAIVSWTTSATGSPTDVDVTNTVYDLDILSGVWREPNEQFGALIMPFIADAQLLLMPTSVSAEIDILGAIGNGIDQESCLPTIPFPTATYEDPFFFLTAPNLPLQVADIIVEIDDLELSGAFAPDGSRIQGAQLRGVIDTADLGPAFSAGADPDAVCELAGAIGVECETCANGNETCIRVWIDDIDAEAAPNVPELVERTQADIDTDPACGATTAP